MAQNLQLRVVALLLLHPLLAFAARRGGGGSGGVSSSGGGGSSGNYDGTPSSGGSSNTSGNSSGPSNTKVTLTFQYAEPIDLAVFSFYVIFAVSTLFQAYAIIIRPLFVQIPLPHIRRHPDETPGTLFEWLLALSSLSLLVYWILSAVFQAILTTYRILPFTPAFFALRQWLYRFPGTLLLCACLLLIRKRARKHAVPTFFKGHVKDLVDVLLVLWIVAAQSLGIVATLHTLNATTVDDYLERVVLYHTRSFHFFTASELALAIDVFIAAVILQRSLRKQQGQDTFIPTLAKRITPLLLILAIFHIIPPIIADQYNFTFNNLIYPELCLSEVLIHGIMTAFTLGYLAGMDRSRYLNAPSSDTKVEIEV
ncbi:hypothetical protein ONZ45_g2190 [Pleurotus djamor]|nr:hypothetical protein ONZ45_g2190 [Pleurotus djamor]